jgi:hypothetical protein
MLVTGASQEAAPSFGRSLGRKELSMIEDAFNLSVRRFLKQVGITAQREIEAAVRQAIAQGNLAGNERLQATAIITVAKTDLRVTVKDEIQLE